MRKPAFYRVKPGLSKSCRQSYNGSFQDSSDAIALSCSCLGSAYHLFFSIAVKYGKRARTKCVYIFKVIIKVSVVYTCTSLNMTAYIYTLLIERRHNNSARRNNCRGNPSREMSASPVILEAVILGISSIIRMTGTRDRSCLGIILASLNSIGNNNGQRCSRGPALEHSAHNPVFIHLHSGCGYSSRGTSKLKHRSYGLIINLDPRSQSVKNHTYIFPVALSKYSNC